MNWTDIFAYILLGLIGVAVIRWIMKRSSNRSDDGTRSTWDDRYDSNAASDGGGDGGGGGGD